MKALSLVPNAVIADKYRLLRPLGEGAMGIVWVATNVLTSRQVALKFIVSPDEELRRRMLREARACGALQHRNIVDVYDVAQAEDGSPFLVMQLLKGETLADLLARTRRLVPAHAAAIARDVASALAAAHAIGMVHRDVKPANVFLHEEEAGGDPIVKVLDFGVSKDLRGGDSIQTVPGGVVGSPSYMSPEQARADQNIDGRADVWSLGVTLFEMLTGTLPFDGNVQEVFRQIFTAEIPVVARRIRQVDPALSDLVSRCMERDRTRRLASAEELVSRLDTFLRSQSPPRSAPSNVPVEGETLKITTVAAEALAPAKNRGAESSLIDAHSRPSSPEDSRSSAPTAPIPQLTAAAPGPPSGVTSSTAPFARATTHNPLQGGLPEPAATPKTAPDRPARRLAFPLVLFGGMSAACALGAILYALPSPQTPPDLSTTSSAATDPSAATASVSPSEPSTTAGDSASSSAPTSSADSHVEEPAPALSNTGPHPSSSPGPARRVTPAASPSAAPITATEDVPFDRSAASKAVGVAAASARGCKGSSWQPGQARVRILFRPNGTVGSVLVDPPFKGTSQGTCIESSFRSVRVPPFGGASVIVTKQLTIQ